MTWLDDRHMQFHRSQAGKIAGRRSVMELFDRGTRRKAIMKKIKSMFFTALVIGVLCAGTVSARQLRSDTKGSATCGGSCGVNNPCRSGCLCIFPMETGSPFCSSHPIPGAAVIK